MECAGSAPPPDGGALGKLALTSANSFLVTLGKTCHEKTFPLEFRFFAVFGGMKEAVRANQRSVPEGD